MTLDDQLRALGLNGPLVAGLAGYSAPQTIRLMRMRGAVLPGDRLRRIAIRLRQIADVAEGLAEEQLTAPTTPASRP